jgi:hypothetical protein
MHIGLIGGIGPTGAFKPKPTVLGNPLPHNYLSLSRFIICDMMRL